MNTGTTTAINAVDTVFGNGLSGISTFMNGNLGGWITFGIIVVMVTIIIGVIFSFIRMRGRN